jgi:hypothetical protein
MGLEEQTEQIPLSRGIKAIVCRQYFNAQAGRDTRKGRDEFILLLERYGWKMKGENVEKGAFPTGTHLGIDQEGNHFLDYWAVLPSNCILFL